MKARLVVLKVQRPLAGNLDAWLYYDLHKDIFFHGTPTRLETELMGTNAKVYLEYWIDGNTITIKDDAKPIINLAW